jgi:hypothetical protein
MFQETLKEELFERGMTWKKLVSERPACFITREQRSMIKLGAEEGSTRVRVP